MKRIFSLVFALLILSSLSLSAYAHEAVDMDREGSVTLELKYEGEPVIGGKFSCVKVAEVICENGNFYFESLMEKKVYRSFEELPDAEDVYQFVMDNKAYFENEKVSHSNTSGTVKFTSRKPGLYLIMQDKAAPGYSKMNPFLVSLPYWEDGKYIYDVTAKTKPSLEPDEIKPTEPEPTEEKEEKLPQTGQLNWPVPVMAAGGLALFVLGWALRFGKKKEDYET